MPAAVSGRAHGVSAAAAAALVLMVFGVPPLTAIVIAVVIALDTLAVLAAAAR